VTAPDIDPIAVARILTGHATTHEVPLTPEEKRYAAWVLTGEEQAARSIGDRLGVSGRTVVRWRSQNPPIPADQAPPAAPWQAAALCAQVGPQIFFAPDDPDEAVLFSTAEARTICLSCPVRPDCLEDAMQREGDADRGNRAGVWGGLSPGQRAALARARHGPEAA
jgi:WhiB family redox-sensing transcriptional regulator